MLILSTVVVCGLVLGAQSQDSFFVPCNATSSDADPPLPVFPNQYQTNVEANIVQKNYTMNIREYYDYTNDRFASERYSRDGTHVSMVSDTEHQEVRLIYPNGTCQVHHINTTGPTFFYFVSGPNGTHVRSIKDLMAFGSEYGEKYQGETTVRGIPVDHWQTCLKYVKGNGQFTLDFYFTKAANYVVDRQRVRIPVRAELMGRAEDMRNRSAGMHSFHHFYDFTDFHAGPIQDQEVFEVPPGTFCNGSAITKPLPMVHAQFTAGVEKVVEMGNNHHEKSMNVFMDDNSNVVRVDATRPLNPDDMRKYGNKPLTYIKDENTDLLYIIDEWELNCTVVKVTGPQRDIPSSLNPAEFLTLFQGDFQYQGKRQFRGFSVESWASFSKADNEIKEMLFHQHEIPAFITPQRDPHNRPMTTTPQLLVGMIIKTLPTNTQRESTTTWHFYGFNPSHPAPEMFDVSYCYSLGHQYMYMAFRVEVNYAKYVEYRKREFYASLKSAIARGAGVSVIRVTAILAEQNYYNESETNVYFKLLDNQVNGISTDNVGPELSKAKVNLQGAIANGLNFDVQYSTIEMNFAVSKGTLWETMSSMDMRTYNPSTMQKYSPGAMAGLAIGMLVIGGILGLLVAFVIYKKVSTSIPYQVTD